MILIVVTIITIIIVIIIIIIIILILLLIIIIVIIIIIVHPPLLGDAVPLHEARQLHLGGHLSILQHSKGGPILCPRSQGHRIGQCYTFLPGG